jgi:hypothetical protein
MITVLVQIKLRDGTTKEEAQANSHAVAPRFQGKEGLQCKYFLYHEEGWGGGFYVWDSREAAESYFNEAWFERMTKDMGTRPQVRYFETAVVVDNTRDEILAQSA